LADNLLRGLLRTAPINSDFQKNRKIQKGVSIERWRQHGEAALEISSTRRSRKPQRIWAALTGGLVFAPGRFTFNSETKIIYAKYDAGAYPAEGVRQAECAFPVPETYSLMVNLNSLFDVIGISRRWA
jgi:hypothetical protein